MHKSKWLFNSTSSDSLKRRATLHTSHGWEAIQTWRLNPRWKFWLNYNTLLVVSGDKQNWDGLAISPHVFTCRTCFYACFCLFFPSLFWGRGGGGVSEKNDISTFISGKRTRIVSSSLTHVDSLDCWHVLRSQRSKNVITNDHVNLKVDCEPESQSARFH